MIRIGTKCQGSFQRMRWLQGIKASYGEPKTYFPRAWVACDYSQQGLVFPEFVRVFMVFRFFMSKNFSIGSREMFTAEKMLLKDRSPNGFKTKSDYSDRWRLFCMYDEEHAVKKMKEVTPAFVIGYGQHLQQQLESGIFSSASAPKNYLSTVNCVMRLATGGQWKTVRPSQDCGIELRKYIPKESKALPEPKHHQIQQVIDDRLSRIIDLQRTLGLRFNESCLFDANYPLRWMCGSSPPPIET